MLIFVLAPIFLVLVYSFQSAGVSLTFDNYKKLLDPDYLNIFLNSVNLSAISSAICVVLGYPIAMIISGWERKGKIKGTLIWLFILPMWMNMLLRTYSWLTILEKNGVLNNLLTWLHLPNINILYTQGAVILGMVYNFLPFMILPVYSVLIKLDVSLIEAAEDLGANSFTVFKKIILPISIPGVISGITMVFLPAVTSFIIPKLLGGGHFMLIGNLIESQFLIADDWNFGSSLSIIMMVMILLCMSIVNIFDKKNSSEKVKKGGNTVG